MGQYQQWLRYRDIDQLLRTQAAALEQELTQLDTQIEQLSGQTTLVAENTILQALLFYKQKQELEQEKRATQISVAMETSNGQHSPIHAPIEEMDSHQEIQPPAAKSIQEEIYEKPSVAAGSVSSALLAWGRLTNFDSQEMPTPLRSTPMPPEAVPSTPRLSGELLPGDMSSFVNTHSQTAPQFKLPWWLRSTLHSTDSDYHEKPDENDQTSQAGPIDQQSSRTNQLVQRWFERRQRFAHHVQESQGEG